MHKMKFMNSWLKFDVKVQQNSPNSKKKTSQNVHLSQRAFVLVAISVLRLNLVS